MKFPRRTLLHLAIGAVASPAVSRIAQAQAYPSRPVRIVIGFPAGRRALYFGRTAETHVEHMPA